MIANPNLHIGIIGLGYVGLPLARLLATRYPTIGFDRNAERVNTLRKGIDHTQELSTEQLQELLDNSNFTLTDQLSVPLRACNVYIIAVPTPVDSNHRPDLKPLLEASYTVGKMLQKGDLVIYESTVYPGMTEEECAPVLEQASALKYNIDFFIGYSPERVNPGDKNHTVERITKVTSGSTPEIADFVDKLYQSVLQCGTFKASSIRVAEAAKIIENTQRDVNIAFMNELAKIFNAMEIDTREVIAAASTKWNFIPMEPGLVGGHCISIDPYYLIQKAQVYGILPRLISEARNINDGMGEYVAFQAIQLMEKRGILIKSAKILILGFSFKENCPDTRNTKVEDLYITLSKYTPYITIHDPWVDIASVKREYHINIKKELPSETFDAVILAVGHEEFKSLKIRKFVTEKGIIYDIKGIFPKTEVDGRL